MLGFVGLDPEICYRAMVSRDARFDGRFLIGVRSTGIYCRPVCPARTPSRRNVSFFACAAAAEEAGFHPCRRCRASAVGPPSTSPCALFASPTPSPPAISDFAERWLRRVVLSPRAPCASEPSAGAPGAPTPRWRCGAAASRLPRSPPGRGPLRRFPALPSSGSPAESAWRDSQAPPELCRHVRLRRKASSRRNLGQPLSRVLQQSASARATRSGRV